MPLLTRIAVLLCALLSAAVHDGLTVGRYALETEKLERPVRVVLLADLHSCRYGWKQAELISKIEEQNPGLILMSGDILDDLLPHTGTTDLLEGIAGRYPCYYVSGNHEFRSGEIRKIKAILRGYGVTVLEGDKRTVEIDGQMIDICGVDDPNAGETVFKIQLADALAEPTGHYTILLTHRPERFLRYARYDCDLALAGHAHGGQMRLPFGSGGLFSPNQGFFPKYTAGDYVKNGTHMIVSRGLSRESSPVPRVFNPPEVVVIDLLPGRVTGE